MHPRHREVTKQMSRRSRPSVTKIDTKTSLHLCIQSVASYKNREQTKHLQDPTYDEEIDLMLRRVRRAQPGRPKQAKGMMRAYLDRFLGGQPDTPLGLRKPAMLCLGYQLLIRKPPGAAV